MVVVVVVVVTWWTDGTVQSGPVHVRITCCALAVVATLGKKITVAGYGFE